MPCDFTVIMHQTAHVGDDEDMFGTAPFKGKDFDSDRFSCPNVDSGLRAVLFFQTRDVDNATNVIQINGSDLFGGIPVSSTGDAESPIWNSNVLLVERNVLKEQGNVLHLGARNSSGGTSGNVDDFLIDNVVILYKTRRSAPEPTDTLAFEGHYPSRR
jgi:hypothetical protein